MFVYLEVIKKKVQKWVSFLNRVYISKENDTDTFWLTMSQSIYIYRNI